MTDPAASRPVAVVRTVSSGIALVGRDVLLTAGETQFFSSLLDAFGNVAADPAIRGVVLLIGDEDSPCGADAVMGSPEGAVIAALEEAPFPVVAALGGAVAAAGCAAALACDARIASGEATLAPGLARLGLIPGHGTTARLVRLVGGVAALELIVKDRTVEATEAVRIGLVDGLAQTDLAVQAVDLTATLAGDRRRLRDCAPPPNDAAAVSALSERLLRRARYRAPVEAAAAAVQAAQERPFAEAAAVEGECLLRLQQAEETAALAHLCEAERSAGEIPAAVEPATVKRVAVVGAGLMGSGIAAAFLASGFAVTLIDSSADALTRAVERIDEIHRRAVETKRIDEAEREGRRASLATGIDLADASAADLVVEAVFEDLDLKKDVFARLDRIVGPETILASNTSYLDLDAIAAATGRPERVVGLHFFSPAHVMRLVEVVRGARTLAQALATALSVARRLDKLPVVARVGEGFIGNRIFSAYRAQCEFLVEDGAMPEDVDRALQDFGFPMGPFAVWDMAGLEIAWRTRKRLAATRRPEERYVPLLDRLCEAGRLGRKSGAGWYRCGEGGRGEADPFVRDLILANSAEKGIERRPIPDEEVVMRVIAAMVNEAALILEEEIAERPSDIDLVLVNGYGFPSHRGGPLFWASRRDPAAVMAALDAVAASTGPTFRRGPVEEVLWPGKGASISASYT